MILTELDDQIIKSLDEIIAAKNETNIDLVNERKQKLENALLLSRMLEPVKSTSSFLDYVSKISKVMADTITNTMLIGQIYMREENYHSNENLVSIAPQVEVELDKVKDHFKLRYKLFAKELDDIYNLFGFSGENDGNISEIRAMVDETNVTINEMIEDNSILEPSFLEVKRL